MIAPGIGTLIGAVVGLAIAEIGSAVGAAQRQSEYQYFAPYILNGQAGIAQGGIIGEKNVEPAQQAQIIAQVQAMYDQTNDAIVRLFQSLGSSLFKGFGAIDGVFQERGSAHTMEHFQQWVNNTLPKGMLSSVEADLEPGFVKLGMSADRFKEIFARLSLLDPTKAIAAMNQYADGLTAINTASAFFHATDKTNDFVGLPTKGSRSFESAWIDASMAKFKTLGDSFAVGDKQIEDLADSLKRLSPESAATAMQQIGQLETQRYQNQLQMVQQLYDFEKQVTQQAQALFETLDVQGLTKTDGTPDQMAIAKYYKEQADKDLTAIAGANNATEAAAAWAKLQHDIMAAEAAGLSQADPAQRKDWIEWARKGIEEGQKNEEAAISRFGNSMNDANNKFNAAMDPIIADFLKFHHDLDGVVGGGGVGDDPVVRFGRQADSAGTNLQLMSVQIGTTTGNLGTLAGALATLESRIVSLGQTIDGIGSGGHVGGSNFVASTQAQRLAA